MHLGAASVPGNSGQASGKEPRAGRGGLLPPPQGETFYYTKAAPSSARGWAWALRQEAGGGSLPLREVPQPGGSPHRRKVRTTRRPEGKAREKPLEPTPQPREARPGTGPRQRPCPEAAPLREREVALALLARHRPTCLPVPPACSPTGVGEPGPCSCQGTSELPTPTQANRPHFRRGPHAGTELLSPGIQQQAGQRSQTWKQRQEIRFCIFFLIKRHL